MGIIRDKFLAAKKNQDLAGMESPFREMSELAGVRDTDADQADDLQAIKDFAREIAERRNPGHEGVIKGKKI